MILKIEKAKLAPIINLFYDLSLRGKQSRHRSKFIKLLSERLEEYQEDLKELLKEHCNLDEKGEPIVKEDNTFDVKDIDAFIKDRKELDEEEIVIEGGDYQDMLKTVKEILMNCDREFSGQEAMIYDYICERFEAV
ncbi:DUF1617 family protein [Aeribacillus composti]|uniref:DUF1617 family protein n=1 Tax=Aeribacillus composti TaxID=1868734 RepID=A0ABY9W651_9BACI|nr:DUF1617 family protein [Aeribacillus composti]WNF31631.1 DUF1617 family protein [Aeribacillus composti]